MREIYTRENYEREILKVLINFSEQNNTTSHSRGDSRKMSNKAQERDGQRRERERRESGRGGVERAILIHLTNSLSMRYTERLPCAAAARTRSTYLGGTPAILAGWHPCGLIYGRALTSLSPHRPRREDTRRCSSSNSSTRTRWEALRRSTRVMGVAKNFSHRDDTKEEKRGRGCIVRYIRQYSCFSSPFFVNALRIKINCFEIISDKKFNFIIILVSNLWLK